MSSDPITYLLSFKLKGMLSEVEPVMDDSASGKGPVTEGQHVTVYMDCACFLLFTVNKETCLKMFEYH